MKYVDSRKLMKDRRVIQEINRYRWIESEKSGRDIGFELAANKWFVAFAAEWVKYYYSDDAERRHRSRRFKPRFIFSEAERQ